jgi:hypothetical protein
MLKSKIPQRSFKNEPKGIPETEKKKKNKEVP